VLLSQGELGPRLTQCGLWAEVYFCTKWRLHPSSRLLTINMGQNLEGDCTIFSARTWPHLTQSRLGRGLPAYQVASSSSRLATTDMGGDCGALAEGHLGPHLTQCGLHRGPLPCHLSSLSPFSGDGAGSPSNTKLPGPRPTSTASGILIHPAIWPQQTWAKNWGALPFRHLVEGQRCPRLTQCGQTEAYIQAKFHLDPSNGLATIHQRNSQDRQRWDSIARTVLQTVAQKLQFMHTVDGEGSKTAKSIKMQY